ncbi:ribonuclease domain-containing protein [Deinococcus arenicola]|uniref:Ribonuclease n=1 Tax=Deinococcus arenicola TaxID=2994950 RepID=A0ABU4DQX3_9DEIO|nr:ribonuclease domain-containing protein [Deinococcus sp. ZS9-10]MDV6374820.1 ribonuclease [Deinococcus sp. ZS9-10]
MKPRVVLLFGLLATLLAACDLPAGGQDTAGQPPAQTQTQQPRTQQPQPQRTSPQQTAPPQTSPQSSRDPQSGLNWVSQNELPREGSQLLQVIGKGGPFRYSKDGVTFGNRERILPRQNGGYYREYTVLTPGEGDRGARRIVCGGQPVTRTAECYYTADHYSSFRRIRP